jgi:hypothetical protein
VQLLDKALTGVAGQGGGGVAELLGDDLDVDAAGAHLLLGERIMTAVNSAGDMYEARHPTEGQHQGSR